MPTSRMRPFKATISLDAARAIIDRTGEPMVRTESIPIDQANNRVVANNAVCTVR